MDADPYFAVMQILQSTVTGLVSSQTCAQTSTACDSQCAYTYFILNVHHRQLGNMFGSVLNQVINIVDFLNNVIITDLDEQ